MFVTMYYIPASCPVVSYTIELSPIWGCSSVGRAPALQAGGQEFESPHLHQFPYLDSFYSLHRSWNSLPKRIGFIGASWIVIYQDL